MIAFFSVVFSAASTVLLWLCLKKLDTISRDTIARDELAETIQKFAALAGGVDITGLKRGGGRGKKVVSFTAKSDPDE